MGTTRENTETTQENTGTTQENPGTPKYLDKTGLSQVWTNAVDNFASKKELTDTVAQAVSGVYKFIGSVNFAELPTEGMKAGHTYNIKDEFETTEAFVDGSGKTYPAGTNVAYTENGWDCLAGIFDFSNFMMKRVLRNIKAAEIDAICVIPTE